MLRQLTLAVLLFAATIVVAVAAAPDITGKWTASFDTPVGQMDYTYDFVVKDKLLTGKLRGSFGDADILEGKVDGETVTFVEMLDGAIRIDYTGKIVSADEIAFTRVVGEFGTEKLVAKRVKK